jgi:hypothetical protein
VRTVRDSALGQSTDLVQAGVMFNDATRLLEGGLWNQPADTSNQQNYSSMYQADITAVSDDIWAILANPAATTIGGAAYTPSPTDVATLTGIEGQLQTLLTTAPNAAGNSASAVQAQQTPHALQTEIINEVANDLSLAAAVNQVRYRTGRLCGLPPQGKPITNGAAKMATTRPLCHELGKPHPHPQLFAGKQYLRSISVRTRFSAH